MTTPCTTISFQMSCSLVLLESLSVGRFAYCETPFSHIYFLTDDPEFPNHKANYREYLQETSRFHEPIPIRDESIQRKIHHTYRLQFLKDVVLARALDDSTFNVLNSCIIFNQIDIIQHVQNDPIFLREVVRLYVDEDMFNGGGIRNRQSSVEAGANEQAPRAYCLFLVFHLKAQPHHRKICRRRAHSASRSHSFDSTSMHHRQECPTPCPTIIIPLPR